jgi:hypothetical protein
VLNLKANSHCTRKQGLHGLLRSCSQAGSGAGSCWGACLHSGGHLVQLCASARAVEEQPLPAPVCNTCRCHVRLALVRCHMSTVSPARSCARQGRAVVPMHAVPHGRDGEAELSTALCLCLDMFWGVCYINHDTLPNMSDTGGSTEMRVS